MANPSPEPQDAADPPPDPSILRAERRIRQLQEAAEIAMKLLEACDPAEVHAYVSISRDIRLTLIQQARIEARLRELMAARRKTATGGANLSASKPAIPPRIPPAWPPTFRSEWRADLPWSPTKH